MSRATAWSSALLTYGVRTRIHSDQPEPLLHLPRGDHAIRADDEFRFADLAGTDHRHCANLPDLFRPVWRVGGACLGEDGHSFFRCRFLVNPRVEMFRAGLCFR